MINKNIFDKAQTFAFLADPTRLKIINLLFEAREKRICVNDIAKAVGASSSATSHQLEKIESRGLVNCQRQGNTMCYKIVKGRLADNIEKLLKVF